MVASTALFLGLREATIIGAKKNKLWWCEKLQTLLMTRCQAATFVLRDRYGCNDQSAKDVTLVYK